MKFYNTTLSNGLTLIGELDSDAVCSAIGFFVKTGARDESSVESGVSHFLEHMLFKGTPTRSALDITFALGAIGAQTNAFTSEENTVYHLAVLPEYLPKGIELLCDMMRPALDETEFNTEKNVILEEIALYQDKPNYMLYEAAMSAYFGGHTAGNSVLGSKESIEALSREQMLKYFERRYVPSNLIFGVAGNFNWSEFVELAEKYCGAWKAGVAERQISLHTPSPIKRTLYKDGLQCAHRCYIAQGPAADDKLRYACSALTTIMGDYTGSRLYWDVVDKGLADVAYIESDCMDSTGIVIGYVSALPDSIEQASECLYSIMKTPRDFSDEDLINVKTKIRTRLVLGSESSMRRLMSLGFEWVYRQRYATIEEELATFNALTRGDINDMLDAFSFLPIAEVELCRTL